MELKKLNYESAKIDVLSFGSRDIVTSSVPVVDNDGWDMTDEA